MVDCTDRCDKQVLSSLIYCADEYDKQVLSSVIDCTDEYDKQVMSSAASWRVRSVVIDWAREAGHTCVLDRAILERVLHIIQEVSYLMCIHK